MLLRVACCSMSFEALNTWVFIKVEISILYRPIWFHGLNIDMSHNLYIVTREYHLTRNTQAGVLCVYGCQKNKPSNEMHNLLIQNGHQIQDGHHFNIIT